MTCHTAPRVPDPAIALYSRERVSQMFWHHHRHLMRTLAVSVPISLVGIVALLMGNLDVAATCGLLTLPMDLYATWHFAKSRLLTQLFVECRLR